MRCRIKLAIALLIALTITPFAFANELIHPKFGGFIDTYWAYSSARPTSMDRQYTTQAARDNEFNVNLAFIEAKIEGDRLHGRIALQAGTSVIANYSSEPNVGLISGSSLSRHIQEAYAGYHIGDSTWIDAGIMLSHIGLESFISRDNATYTRSLVADFSPYYQAGVRLSHQFNGQWNAQLLVLNGWQNISESNRDKAIGTQLSFQVNPDFLITYNTFFGKEAAFRQFHDFVLKYNFNSKWTLAAQIDYGVQNNSWYGFTLISRHSVSEKGSVAARIERYSDQKNILVVTSNASPFQVWGISLGYDHTFTPQLVWRNEIKNMMSDQNIYKTSAGTSNTEALLVSSLGLSF